MFIVGRWNDIVHGIGVSEVVNMEKVVFFSQQIEGIESICLQACTPVNKLTSISIENSPFSITFSEGLLESFSDSVHVLAVNLCSDLKIVVTIDDLLIIGGEQNGSILSSDDSKVEGRLGVLERHCGVGNWEWKAAFWVDRKNSILRPFEAFIVGIGDFEREIKECVGVESKGESFDDGWGFFDEVVIGAGVV